MKPRDDLPRAMEDAYFQWHTFIESLVPQVQSFALASRRVVDALEPELRKWTPFLEDLARNYGAIVRDLDWVDRIISAGFLPHASAPAFLPEETDGEQLAGVIEGHYRANWASIRLSIENSLETFLVDEEAKALFREGLDAHEAGLYRASVRALFPEIERVARVEWGIPLNGQPVKQKLRPALERLPRSAFGPLRSGRLQVLRSLVENAWIDVDTPVKLEMAARSQIPNRHASLHGLIAYNTYQHSLNAIFLTENVFAMVTAYKISQQVNFPEAQ